MTSKFSFKSLVLTLIFMSGLHLNAHNLLDPALSDTIDVVKYELHLTVVNLPQQTISGRAGIHFTTPLNGISQLPLELKQLQVDSVKSGAEFMLDFTHSGQRLLVDLDQPVSAGDTSLVWVFYHGQPFHESWGGFHFSEAYAFNLGVGFESIPHNLGKTWFPCVDDFIDRAYYEYYIRVENTNTAVCGGLLQSVTDMGDGTRIFYWKSGRTLPTYLASVAVGPYALVTDTVAGEQEQIPVTYYVKPADTTRARGSFVNLSAITGIYEEAFGTYPFQRIGITGTALGAMEHAESIFYPNNSINGNLSDEWLYAHELSHMWFGDQVTCASDADMWLNEGWARWCETFYREKLYGIESALNNMRPLMRDVLQYIHTKEGGYRPLSPMPSEYTYGDNVYDKGGITTHALRGYLGDSLFFSGVKVYLETFSFNPASSYDLRDNLTQSTGIDMTGFFDFHVFGPGFNHFTVDSFNVVPAGNEYDVEVFIKQRLKGTDVYATDCRFEITFMDNSWQTETKRISFPGPHGSGIFRLPFEPTFVMTDLYERAGGASTDNYKTIKNTGLYDYADTYFKLDVTHLTDSAFVRATHNWVPPDSLLTPVPGLTLSDYRYWTIEGIFPEGFEATGRFTYNRNSWLDNNLIKNSEDSLVILHRPDASHEWQPVSFTRVGPWHLGIIYVPHIMAGDYTLAIWDALYVGNNTSPVLQESIRIFPNPANQDMTIETGFPGNGTITVHDTAGKLVFSGKTSVLNKSIRWNCSTVLPGTYLLTYESDKGITRSNKIIIKH
ncbi:MAG: M1 family aminopeptidase [Bacteroidota bacterium]